MFTALPSLVRSFVFVWSTMLPVAASTSGRARTLSSVPSGIGGGSVVSPWNEISAVLPETTTSVFA